MLVLNETRVIPARLYGRKEGTGGAIEFLLLKRIDRDTWEVILKPGRKAKPGAVFVFGEGLLKATVLDMAQDGGRIVRFAYEGVFEEILDRLGQMPLPPYIHEKLSDKERYQTVYARRTAPPPRRPQVCTLRRSCWKKSGQGRLGSCPFCCTWDWARSDR